MRRTSSQARNGSLLECTTIGPAVSYLNRSAAAFRQASERTANKTRLPSEDHSISALSAAYLPLGSATSVNLSVARSQITGANVSPLRTSNPSLLPSGDQRIARICFFV